jgi:polar amino acid transport system permease protein
MTVLASIFSGWPDWLDELLGGLFMSMKLTLAILALGLPLGLLFALGVASPVRLVRWSAIVLVEIARGLPALVLVYLVYFGLPQADLTLSAFAAGTAALGLTLAGYTSEVFRAGIAAVPAGQREAARAIGLSRAKELRLVVLPQALRISIPPILGYAILYFQATSLCFAIAVPELLSRAYTIGSSTFRYLSVLLLAGLMFAAVCIPASQFVDLLERRRERRV